MQCINQLAGGEKGCRLMVVGLDSVTQPTLRPTPSVDTWDPQRPNGTHILDLEDAKHRQVRARGAAAPPPSTPLDPLKVLQGTHASVDACECRSRPRW